MDTDDPEDDQRGNVYSNKQRPVDLNDVLHDGEEPAVILGDLRVGERTIRAERIGLLIVETQKKPETGST